MRKKLSIAKRGKRLSGQHIANQTASSARRRRAHPTKWETALRQLLRGAGLRCRYERVFRGNGLAFAVDAYVPSRRIAFEADTHWFHGIKKASGQEEARDLYLMTEHGLLAVVHLSKDDLRPFL